MDRLSFELKIVDLLDDACSELSARDFEVLLERIKEVVENYE